MPNTSQLSFPIMGMSTDLHRLNTDEKTYAFALNAVTSDFFPGNEFLLSNEPSNVCSTEFPPNYQVVGFVEIPEQKRTVYILLNPTNGNVQFGETLNCGFKEVTDNIETVYCANCPEYVGKEKPALETTQEVCFCQYYLITQANCLNLDVNYPVDIEYKLTNCGIQLYYTDNLNERGFIYFDYENGSTSDHLILNNKFKTKITGQALCDCPDGYVYDELANNCKQQVLTPIDVSSSRIGCATESIAYTNFGVALYDVGYNINGTGSSAIYHTADPYWSNPSVNDTDGVLNRTALWACDNSGNPQGGEMLPLNEYIGFIFPLDVTETKTYYIGIAGDNIVRIRIDCNTVMEMDATAMAGQYPVAGISAPFKYWHVYPITLTAGHHVVELTGYNFDQVAGFGAEVYDNTAAEIIAATGGSGLNILFSTENSVGQLLQVSSTFVGECPSGACLDIIDNVLVCVENTTVPADCSDCKPIVYNDEVDCTKLKVHPDYDNVCTSFVEFVGGGNLKEGVYQVLFAYSDQYGNPLTNYFNISQTIPLFNEQIKFETNQATTKALKFTINNLRLDTFFENYNIVIAQTIDNFTEFNYLGTYSVNQNQHVYTGYEGAVRRLTPQELFYRIPFYQTARGVTKANDYIFNVGVKEYPTLNLQRVANNINVYWETVALKENAYYDPRNTFYFHTYQRDEVYAIGIVFEYSNGRETCAFHIPGREATSYDLELISNADVIEEVGCDDETLNERWKIYNTGDILGGDYEYNENCQIDNCWEYGNFSYWESTEKYPNVPEVWGELCGTPIRHHKFPDSCVTHIHDSNAGTKTFKDNNYIFPIGIRIDNASVQNALQQAVTDGIITQAQKDDITGYRIVRGNRLGNKSIDAKGLLFNMMQYTKDGEVYYFPNYAYNDLSADDFLNGVSNVTQRYTFHSPDTHFVNAGLGDILKIETEEYGKSEGYFTYSECQAKHKFLSTFAHTLAFGLGIAAALSATGEKKCEVITYKADDIVGAHTVNSNGSAPYGNVTGSAPGAIITTPATAPWNGTANVPDVTIRHDQGNYTTYDPLTGLPTGSANASERQITTCKGQAFQVFNSNSTILSLLGGASSAIQRTMIALIEMDKILDTMRTLIKYRNYSIQYNSIGKYNNYTCVAEGNKVRKLQKTAYLTPHIQLIDEPASTPDSLFETIKINNWDRESSVYLKTATTLANPIHADNSKVSMSTVGFDVDDLNRRFQRDIASYYASVKRYVPNQYGQICNINYIETSGCNFSLNKTYTACETKVFGGDTFINRFGLKRKMPFFLHTMCGLPDGSDVLYDELGNAGVPKYYFNTPEPLADRIADSSSFAAGYVSIITAMITDNDKNYDVHQNRVFNQQGYIHMFNYGIPYFLVESDINVDYRHGQNNKEKDFYPHNKDLKTWLEEENVPIHEDNYYFYNRTYSKQSTENPICTSCIKDIKELTCLNDTDNRIIYSESSTTENRADNWLIFKANSFYDFPLTLGKLISADGIENEKVLVRLEKGSQIFNAYNTIQATEENIQVGTGGIFQSRPRDIAISDLGYAGTQHRDILHTEFGHIWADAERGQVINVGVGGQSIDELTKENMRNWFKENLPFQIRKDFPEIAIEDIDNNLNGIGLHYCFDKRFNRILITKLDYKTISSDVKYDKTNKKFYTGTLENPTYVELYNPRYFCNKGWTISYSFFQKAWTSFHSYKPNFYVEHIENFESGYKRIGTNNQKTYLHNASNKSYQVFYGRLEPFIIEFASKYTIENNFLHSVKYYLEVVRYHNEFDVFHNRTKTFNKAIVYNQSQTSGMLNMVVSNPEDLTEVVNYPKLTENSYTILTTNSEGFWQFNDFWDLTRSQLNNVPIFNYECNNVNKTINPKAINYNKPELDRQGIRGKNTRVRLINDAESNYKFIFNFGVLNQRQSSR